MRGTPGDEWNCFPQLGFQDLRVDCEVEATNVLSFSSVACSVAAPRVSVCSRAFLQPWWGNQLSSTHYFFFLIVTFVPQRFLSAWDVKEQIVFYTVSGIQ